MKVMDNKLFAISPKSGKLQAGSTCAITFTYHHLMPGTDRVPVLLKLSRGREIMVCKLSLYLHCICPTVTCTTIVCLWPHSHSKEWYSKFIA